MVFRMQLSMIGIVKVLIVKLSAFGDIIHALPALDDVLARPEVTEVHWLVDSRFAFVTEVFPPQVKVHQIALKGGKPLSEIRRVVKELRKENFDFALDLQGLIKSAVMARLICSKVYGFDVAKIREKPASWMQDSVKFHSDEKTITQQCRKIAHAPWIDGDTAVVSVPYAPPTIQRKFDVQLPEEIAKLSPFVILNLGGSFATKALPDKIWLGLADRLMADGYTPVWCWGSEAEKEKGIQLSQGRGYVLPNRLGMTELCTLFRQSFAVVAADTGILHLASAAGAYTISFWGPTPCWRNAPHGPKDQHVESNPACGPCIQKTCDNFICMDMITVDALYQCVKNIEEGKL